MNIPAIKYSLLISTNILIISLLFYLQNSRHKLINTYNFHDESPNEVLRDVAHMLAAGEGLNTVLISTLVLFVMNLFLLKNWIKAKRWVIGSIILLITKLGISLYFGYQQLLQFS